MNLLKKLACSAALLSLALWSTPILATTILTGHPVVHALASDLATGSNLEVLRAAPANIPPTRLLSYLTDRGEAAFIATARRTDAVITLRSIWPEDPLYPLARRSQIRIVEIDAALPIDGALPGIALQTSKSSLLSQPWLDPVNLGRMADILANELGRLEPAAQPTIMARLATLKRRLITLTARNEAALAAAENVTVASMGERLDYLISGLNLERIAWPASRDPADLAQQLHAAGVTLVLGDTEVEAAFRQALEAKGIRLRVLLASSEANPLDELETISAQISSDLLRSDTKR